jgi:hypothetical protein
VFFLILHKAISPKLTQAIFEDSITLREFTVIHRVGQEFITVVVVLVVIIITTTTTGTIIIIIIII